MPLDPQAQSVLDVVAALNLPANHTVSPDEARANAKMRPRAEGPEVAKVEDRLIPGPGTDIPVRIYTPAGPGPFPILAWFHGGGWVVGDLDSADGAARKLTVGANSVTISVDYRLAPETKFPGASDDCYTATAWAARHATELNGDASRLAVGGDSAGGNLAAAVSLMARDRQGPSIVFQLLIYPVTDCDFTTASYTNNAEGYLLSKASMEWYWDHYLSHPSDASNPYAAPLQAKDLSGLPPALVVTAEYDPLCDEGEAYGARLKAAGIPTVCTRYDGMIHGFFGMWAALNQGQQAIDEASAALRQAFGPA
ncbi:MAG: lipase [Candidatus Entotheonella factor]|uniref:Lipase n=1 Tax=Entotheonella factor TaxID=1429438 RepID=W4LRA5_ENTF1|nr:MAG: lipase [Candidatus Entotheonella factor]